METLMTNPRPAAIAERLLAARAGGRPLADYADGPADEAEALAVQPLVAARLGPVGGFKTGRRDPAAVPLMAPIPADVVLPSGTTPDPATSRLRGVELEIGFRFDADPPPTDAPDFEARLRAAVTALPCLEIVESRLSDPDAAGALWRLADNQINGALVTGAPCAGWRDLGLALPAVTLRIGGVVVVEGAVATPGGCAFATLSAFVRTVGGHAGGLRRGHVVITGSLTGLRYAAAGDAVEGEIAGLGRVGTRFA
jgi:2-keto-4-pentenoate hydratase